MINTDIRVYVIHDEPSNLVVIGSLAFTGLVETSTDGKTTVRVLTSPQMTKFGFGIYNATTNVTTIHSKHVDWSSNRMMDAVFRNPT